MRPEQERLQAAQIGVDGDWFVAPDSGLKGFGMPDDGSFKRCARLMGNSQYGSEGFERVLVPFERFWRYPLQKLPFLDELFDEQGKRANFASLVVCH